MSVNHIGPWWLDDLETLAVPIPTDLLGWARAVAIGANFLLMTRQGRTFLTLTNLGDLLERPSFFAAKTPDASPLAGTTLSGELGRQGPKKTSYIRFLGCVDHGFITCARVGFRRP